MNARMMFVTAALVALPFIAPAQANERVDTSCYRRIASYSQAHLQKAARVLRANLNCDNEGVVESSIALCAFLRVAAPHLDLGDLQRRLGDVAISGATPAIRYKAFLATIVFENPRDFQDALPLVGSESGPFFETVSARVSKILVSNGAQ